MTEQLGRRWLFEVTVGALVELNTLVAAGLCYECRESVSPENGTRGVRLDAGTLKFHVLCYDKFQVRVKKLGKQSAKLTPLIRD